MCPASGGDSTRVSAQRSRSYRQDEPNTSYSTWNQIYMFPTQDLHCPPWLGSSSASRMRKSSELLGSITYGLLTLLAVKSQEDIRYARLQRRFIHRVGQMAEQHLESALTTSVPTASCEHELHPALTTLGYLRETSIS